MNEHTKYEVCAPSSVFCSVQTQTLSELIRNKFTVISRIELTSLCFSTTSPVFVLHCWNPVLVIPVKDCVSGNAVNQMVLEEQCYWLIIPVDLLIYYRYI